MYLPWQSCVNWNVWYVRNTANLSHFVVYSIFTCILCSETVYMCVCVYVCMCMFVCVCVCVCMCVYVCVCDWVMICTLLH